MGPNQEVETLVHIHISKVEHDFPRMVIQVQERQVWKLKLTLKCCSNRLTKQDLILIQKFELVHKIKDLSYIPD